MLIAVAAAPRAVPADDLHAIHSAAVTAVSQRRPVLALDLGRTDGLQTGDRVLLDDGEQVIAAGEIIYLEAHQAGVKFEPAKSTPTRGMTATIVSPAAVPPGATLCRCATHRIARVDSILPGGDRLWLDTGPMRPLARDRFVILLAGERPIAFGRITRAGRRTALVELVESYDRNRPPCRGDLAELINASDDANSRNTRVTEVSGDAQAQTVTLAGAGMLEFSTDDRLDVYRGDDYIGFARVTRLDPAAEAEFVPALSRCPAKVGDRVESRARPRTAAQRSGYVFRTEGDYGLVSLGELDDIKLGDHLRMLDQQHQPLELVVEALFPDHCGASMADRESGERSGLTLWSRVTTIVPDATANAGQLRHIAATPSPFAPWLLTAAGRETTLHHGDLVCIAGRDRAVGIVAKVIDDQLLIVRLDHLRY